MRAPVCYQQGDGIAKKKLALMANSFCATGEMGAGLIAHFQLFEFARLGFSQTQCSLGLVVPFND